MKKFRHEIARGYVPLSSGKQNIDVLSNAGYRTQIHTKRKF